MKQNKGYLQGMDKIDCIIYWDQLFMTETVVNILRLIYLYP